MFMLATFSRISMSYFWISFHTDSPHQAKRAAIPTW